jgi:hypothetical protein
MNVNDACRFIINYSILTLQIVVSLTDDSKGIFYDRNVPIAQADNAESTKFYVTSKHLSRVSYSIKFEQISKFNIGLF